MIEKIIQIGNQISDIVEPFYNQVLTFLEKEFYILYAVIFLFVGILTLIGLFTFLKRTPKLFLTLVILLGIVVALWYFIIQKQ